MREGSEFDLPDFQRKVLKSYRFLTGLASDKVLISDVNRPARKRGWFKTFLKKILIPFKLRLNKLYVNSEGFVALERKADSVVFNPQIKRLLCPALNKKIELDLFAEELEVEMVIIVTSLLTNRKIVKDLSLEENELLFALILDKILRVGIETYCTPDLVKD